MAWGAGVRTLVPPDPRPILAQSTCASRANLRQRLERLTLDIVIKLMHAAGDAVVLAVTMLWEVFWPLALGFLLSALVQTFVSQRVISRALGADSARAMALATLLGAASSSCSYAAVAIARSLFQKGATLRNAIIFEFASTNLVFELGLALLVLLGWQFLAAELAGGVLMVLLLAVLFRLTFRPTLAHAAREQAQRGLLGRMEGHAGMDMSLTEGPLARRLLSPQAFTTISHYFFMDIWSIATDLALGFLIAGALGAWVPESFWSGLFLTGHPLLAALWGPIIGPLLAVVSFVCSVGNVPLAAVLWNGGISFGGVISFIFADLIIIPILNIHRRYYGRQAMLYILILSYITMVLAGLIVSLVFGAAGWTPEGISISILESHIQWGATSLLDVIFLALIVVLGVRFLTTGGVRMLRAMEQPLTATTSPHQMPAGHTMPAGHAAHIESPDEHVHHHH